MLDIEALSICFSRYVFGLKRREVCAIQSLDVRVESGSIMAIVGQSGGGKSLLAHALLGILPANARVTGSMRFKGKPLTPQSIARLRGREIALVPQSVASLNPLLRIGVQVARSARLSGLKTKQSITEAHSALKRYGLGDEVSRRFPFELSGGMAKRVLTATATVGLADLIIADEPTNGQDEKNAQETLKHLRELADTGKAVLLITHDIASALRVADAITIFYGGVTVEECPVHDMTAEQGLRHPYSQALWAAVPENGLHMTSWYDESPLAQPGTPIATGCPFCEQCGKSQETCRHQFPLLRQAGSGRIRCHHA
ncbi:ABC transporter ATP-binding protein [Desulfovibrio inopinatus]|uniref:ATP-binding cassette domain-containing protein n=1 Tax=Desulfovibrio inopinatus TaxID=102109 RepID=UPI00040BCD2A|nr:ABC transporter ATP-binding protein [Desulfovibrio inopinatus]